ncbi:MAG: ADP/ATP-dependent (S)-NAD(P)H-hydrate dehydratase, partial [Pseudomonadota bacterium]
LEVAAHITATMMRRVEDATALRVVLQDARFNALAAGPGLGLDRARDLLPEFLRTHRPTVLDADALTAYADDPDALIKGLHPDCILTPHSGEFARLFPAIAETLNRAPTSGPAYSKVDATRAAAASAGCMILLKGPDTVIAAPDGRCVVHSAYYDRAAPWLATAGAGDVLAGFVTGLLARGFDPLAAAETAAWLHVECARVFGPGLVAEDLPEILPQVFRDLGL